MLIARIAPQMSVHTLKLGEKGLRGNIIHFDQKKLKMLIL